MTKEDQIIFDDISPMIIKLSDEQVADVLEELSKYLSPMQSAKRIIFSQHDMARHEPWSDE